MQALLDAGADVNARDYDGRSPLHECCACQHAWKSNASTDADRLAIAQALVRQGADVNAKDNTGHTPLALARESKAPDALIQFLISAGAH